MTLSVLRFVAAIVISLAGMAANARTLTWAASADALTMDPHATNNSFTTAFVSNVYETLVRFDDKLRIEPALAESWTVLSPTTWRFKLRRGVRFHNGDPLTADDVVFSWQRIQSPGALVKGTLGDILDVRKVDGDTVDIETRGPFPLLLNALVNLHVMSKKWCEQHNAQESTDLQRRRETYANLQANGTGPFVLESREVDARTVLAANPDWWDKPKHNLTKVVFHPVRSDATRTSSLLSGAIDVVVSVPLQDVPRLMDTGTIQVVQGPELRTLFLGMDQHRDELLYSDVKGRNPFKDVRVRKAIYQAIDIEAIKRTVMRGVAWPAGMIVSPLLNGAPTDLNGRLLPHDPEAARRLLAQAGYEEGFTVGLQCPSGRYVFDEQICVAVAAMLQRVGIKVGLQVEPVAKWSARLNTNDVSLYLVGHAGLPMADAYAVLTDVVATQSRTTGSLNAGRYSNASFDALLPKIAAEIDTSKRVALIREAVSIERSDVSHIPLHQQPIT
ncbi:MAG: ABC transporter substrate-binding protein, partial [Burkholderiales bacterium]